MENIDRIVKIVLIGLIIFAIIMQVRIVQLVMTNKASLDSDPLVVAANKYDIENCECQLSNTTKIVFNKNISRTVIQRYGYNAPLNFSWDSRK